MVIISPKNDIPIPVSITAQARQFAEPFIGHEQLVSGENELTHADAESAILRSLGGADELLAAPYLVYACAHLSRPQEVLTKVFGAPLASLAVTTHQLTRVQAQARGSAPAKIDTVRKMLLAFSRDLRVVLMRLASRLQTLRFHAANKLPLDPAIAAESLQVFAPLANRLGIWQIKWELEDLAFRFSEPDVYRDIAAKLQQKRAEREQGIQALTEAILRGLTGHGPGQAQLNTHGLEVQGRPKHIYSIVKKMRGKSLAFDHVFDVQALRIITPSVTDCYAALSWVHEHFTPIESEFDDYIARPKPNGYQSLHTVVRDGRGAPIEVQIRTRAMHEHAESGVAAHWAYKEAGTKGYAGVLANSDYDSKIAMLRQLLAWERDLSGSLATEGISNAGLFDDRIYVLTPEAAVVDLPKGATPVDFAYALHTDLGHRCRGAHVDGVLVPLNTALQNGQTVSIVAAKDGGPSRDWLNFELGFVVSSRAKTKIRAWFNAQALQSTIAKGREAVEKLLQREGKTALKLDTLAEQLGFKGADALFEVVGKDELSLRSIETVLRPPEALPPPDERLLKRAASEALTPKGGILVVGIDSLMTQLAKCCKPAPPDPIGGFVTRGKGVSVHRLDCRNFKELVQRSHERVIQVTWGQPAKNANGSGADSAKYPVDVSVEANDRQGLLRDVSDVFSRQKTNVIGVQTQTIQDGAWMTFTVEVSDSTRLDKVLHELKGVKGVTSAKRR